MMNPPMPSVQPLIVRRFGVMEYEPVLAAMREFTDRRAPDTVDECWLLQHQPVFTQGLNGKPEHVLDSGDIPIVKADRGGQVTYHGPGQLMVYCLFDLRRHELGVRELICRLESMVIELLGDHGIDVRGDRRAPGVYTPTGEKLASVGLRVRRGCCYHGLSLNVAMDLGPFRRINPCGFAGLRMTQLRDLGVESTPLRIANQLLPILCTRFGYRPEDAAESLPPTTVQEFDDVRLHC